MSKLTVRFSGRVNGTVFDEREVKFPLGEGTEFSIPEGLERSLERFKKGEKSTIKLSPKVKFNFHLTDFVIHSVGKL